MTIIQFAYIVTFIGNGMALTDEPHNCGPLTKDQCRREGEVFAQEAIRSNMPVGFSTLSRMLGSDVRYEISVREEYRKEL